MGWLNAIGSIFTWLGGEGIAQSLVRVAIGLGLSSLLRNNATDNPAASNTSSTPKGTRQQISPATDNKLPIAYGDSYFSGTITDVALVNDNKEMYAVLALCEKTGDIFSSNVTTPASRTLSSITIDDIYISNQRVTFKADGTTIDYTTDETGVVDTNLHDLVSICLYKGDSNSPMLPCQTGTTTPITGTVPPVAYSVMPGWDTSYTMENIIFAVIKTNYDPSKGTHTIPQLKFHVRNTLNKPGDVLHDYATNVMYGAGLDSTMIDETAIVALNTYSDEMVTYTPYAAQKRYVINGLIRTTDTVLSNMEKIAATAGAYISYDVSTGKWSTFINKATSKTLDFNDSNIIGQLNVTGSNLDNYYNQIEVQFPYAVLKDQYNFVRVNLPEAYLNTNEQPNLYQLTHELTNNVVQASVLANLDLRQSREDLIATFNTDYSKYNVQIGDVIGITNSVYGFIDKLFRVIRIKKNESDSGELVVEITGQAYNADVYTVEPITDFVPLIGVGHSLPSLGPIATPIAPAVSANTTSGTTITSQPSITITGTVPTGVVTDMEFWYSNDTNPDDNLRNYTMLGTMRAENSGPFTIGDTPSFKTVLLSSGTYYFKVRAANASGSSKFSSPSVATPYTYVAAPDVLPYVTPVTDVNGSLAGAAAGGMSMGMMAGYLATKLNWFGPGGLLSNSAPLSPPLTIGSNYTILTLGNTNFSNIGGQNIVGNTFTATAAGSGNGTVKQNATLQSVLGLSNSNASNIGNVVAADSPTLTAPAAYDHAKASGTTLSSATGTTLNFRGENGIEVTGDSGTNTIIISANLSVIGNGSGNIGGNGGGNVATTITSTLAGHVFPALFGDGPALGATTRAGIFTHDHLVIGGSGATAKLKANNVITSSKVLSPAVSGQIQYFYNIPGVSSFSQKPFYVESETDKYAANTSISLYYATATYAGGNLDAQSWSAWTRLGSSNGVTGFNGNMTVPDTYANVWTNPPPTISYAPYIVEEAKQTDGEGNVTLTPTVDISSYDPFKPNVLKTVVTHYPPIFSNNLAKTNSVSSTGTHTFAGGTNDLIIFGTSPYNLPDGTAFNNNTLFGHQNGLYVQTYLEAKSFRQVASNGSIFVGIDLTVDKVYWSTDGSDWRRIELDADVSSEDPDWVSNVQVSSPDDQVIPPFKFVVYDGSKFILYGFADQIATSTDGKIWTEVHTAAGLDATITHVIADSGKYLAVGISGVQTSSDGITWGALTLPAVFASRGPTCGCWDGSQFIVGGRWTLGSGSVMYSSATGDSWSVYNANLNNPSYSQNVSVAENNSMNAFDLVRNDTIVGMLP